MTVFYILMLIKQKKNIRHHCYSIDGTPLHEIAQFILNETSYIIYNYISSPVTALANYNFDLIDIIAYHGLLMVHFFDGTSLH